MSACILPIIPGGSTCWNGARPRRTRPPSISTGSSCRYRARGGVLLPILGSSYGQALERGEIELRYDRRRRQFFGLVFRASAADRAGALRRNPAHDRQGSRRRAKRAPARHMLALASRYAGLRHPNRKEAPGFKARVEGDRRRRRDHRARARRLSRRTGSARADAGAASSAGTPALQARPLAARLQRHQLPPLLRRQHAGGIARRGRRHVRGDPSPGQAADRGRQAAGPAARSHRRLARSRRNISSACAAWSARRRATAPSRSTW